ncbi:MAG TPA: hypothetical protein VFA19_02030 [Gaiellaceae bacterium]|nr:hypothetical protein [Gaiellaceae bacterium]
MLLTVAGEDLTATRGGSVFASCLASAVSDVRQLRPGVRDVHDAGGLRRRTT